MSETRKRLSPCLGIREHNSGLAVHPLVRDLKLKISLLFKVSGAFGSRPEKLPKQVKSVLICICALNIVDDAAFWSF